jgi:hypothetical protein
MGKGATATALNFILYPAMSESLDTIMMKSVQFG